MTTFTIDIYRMIYKEVFGTYILQFDEVLSTNFVANSMLKLNEVKIGTVIKAEFQTAGKGQDQNSWESEARKNLLFSIIMNSDFLPPEKQFYLNKIVSLAVTDLLINMMPKKKINIKWPNDIYVGDRKIAGILINNTIKGSFLEHSVLGIGLNVNQKKFLSDAPNPISIANIKRKEINREACFNQLLDQLNFRCRQLQRLKFEEIDKDYMNRLYRFKQLSNYIINDQEVVAKITGLDEYGKLCLKDKKGKAYCCDLKEIKFII